METRRTDAGLRSPYREPELDTNRFGVTEAELKRWFRMRRRFEPYIEEVWPYSHDNPDYINLHEFPRKARATEFLDGESYYGILAGQRNLVNNPLGLVRPLSMHSFQSYHAANGEKEILEYREGYYKIIVDFFERFAGVVLKSVNSKHAYDYSLVRLALSTIFKDEQSKYCSMGGFAMGEDMSYVSGVEKQEEWLLYGVLNVLDYPSNEINATGRMRVLEHLRYPSTRALADVFRSVGRRNFESNGYDQSHIASIPERFLEGASTEFDPTTRDWFTYPAIQELLVYKQDREGKLRKRIVSNIDWEKTAEGMAAYPEEAIQLALLFLHHPETTMAGIHFLRNVPKLDGRTQYRMFGPDATFYAEHGKQRNAVPRPQSRMRVEQLNGTYCDPQGYYAALRLSPADLQGLDADEISSLVRGVRGQWSKLAHPDRHGGDDSTMKHLNEAAEVLSDPEKRKAYDGSRK